MLGRLKRRLRALLRKGSMERELDEEMRFHLERQTELNVAGGMSASEARRAALRSFGGVERAKEQCREARGVRLVEDLRQDLAYGARTLFKKPGFTLVAVCTLALGIGANTAIFSIVNGVLLRPLPYPEPERLERVTQQNSSMNRFGISVADFQAIEKEYKLAEGVAAFTPRAVTLTGGERPEQVRATFVTAGFFETLGVVPVRGRAFLPGEDRPGAEQVVVVGEGFWRRHLAARPEALGRRLTLDGVGYTVVGIMPPDFISPEGTTPDLWPILQLQPPQRRGPFTLRVIARRGAGVSEQQGQEELKKVARELYPQWAHTFTDANATYVSTPLKQALVGDIGTTLLVLLGAVGCVLLLASVNVANLLLARATTRQRELAIRAALGAGRFRLLRQLFTESVLLAVLGGAAGLLLAVWGVDVLLALSPESIPRLDQVRIDGRVLGFAALGTLLSCLVFGLAPALYSVSPDLDGPLKGGGRGGSEVPGRRRLREVLVVFEFALALPLLVGAGLMLGSFMRLQRVEPGFDSSQLLTMRVPLPAQKYPQTEQAVGFNEELVRKVQALPGVQTASVSSNLPLDNFIDSNNFDLESRPTPPGKSQEVAENMAVGPDYFRALGIPLLKGRYLNEQDDAEAPRVMVISKTMSERYFPEGNAVGMRLKTGGCTECEWTTIVGVVGDVKDRGLGAEVAPAMYVPFAQEPLNVRMMNLVLRAEGDPASLISSVRREVNALDPDLALADIKTMEQLKSESLGRSRYRGVLSGIFAAVALALAAVGIYGVIAYAVNQRTREIGIRIALGARRRDIFRLVVGRGLLLSLTGVAFGVAASLVLTRFLSSLLYGVSSTDPATFASVALLLIAVALLACSIPARHATRVDPLNALRHE
ncbi:MAG TPA: ABC transporter permease [Pyrinomonadaceae bacterium]|nr:ABC transporter permease [Pyrinomonadaceae bacterium]